MFSSVTSSVTSWFGGIKPEDTSPEAMGKTEAETETGPETEKPKTETAAAPPVAEPKPQAEGGEGTENPEEKKEPEEGDFDLDEMSAKAVNAAKEWGTYLFSVGKTATEQVAKTAKQLKETVEDHTILGDFHKEQDKFVTENREQKQKSEAAVAPWVGYNEEETMKSQILALSSDQRNFLRNPPSGVQFQYDFQASHPVAMAMLQEDPNLEKMRFELVPKQVKEDIFWRNYFYRVSLIKQSAQLTSLAQQTGSTGEISISKKEDTAASRLQAGAGKEEEREPEELPQSSPQDHEFISDAFQHSQLDEEDIKKEMQQLGMQDQPQSQPTRPPAADEDIPDWERELQEELQEYEVVDDGVDADLEQEILQQIEAEAQQS